MGGGVRNASKQGGGEVEYCYVVRSSNSHFFGPYMAPEFARPIYVSRPLRHSNVSDYGALTKRRDTATLQHNNKNSWAGRARA